MTEPQITRRVLMIRPAGFGSNPETAASNAFQQDLGDADADAVHRRALAEFEGLVAALRAHGVDARVCDDRPDAPTPDAVFPNNWISFHADGTVVTYPLLSPLRRREVRPDLIERLEHDLGVCWPHRVDLAPLADDDAFLEGTGSLVLDRTNRIAYACRSPRTTDAGLDAFAARLAYDVVAFDAVDNAGQAIYHTNVMMSVGDGVAIVCLDCIPDAQQRERVRCSLDTTDHEVIPITTDQLNAFAGNALAVAGAEGAQLIVMSDQARDSLEPAQIEAIQRHGAIVSTPLDTIESIGGGSARCMLAEIHAPTASSPPRDVAV